MRISSAYYPLPISTVAGITESFTDPPAVPPANLVGGAFGSDGRWVSVVEGALLQGLLRVGTG